MARPAALVLLTLGCWATGVLPFHVTGIGLFVLATLFGIAPPRVIFAGFTSSALWLVFGGLVIGAAVQTTGLGRRLARLLVGHLGGSYRRIVYGTVGLGAGLAFLVPAAMGRVMILVPIFAALTAELGFTPGRRGRTGILLAVAFGIILPAFAILPANLPNMVLLGVAETLYGVSISYAAWLLLHFPLLGLGYGLLLAELVCRLFPDRADDRPLDGDGRAGRDPRSSWSPAERRLLGILVLALLLWATDSLHGLSPGWVALAAALVCMLPGVGVLDPRSFETATSFGTFFYVAGLLGMVSLIDASGLAGALELKALAWLPLAPDQPVEMLRGPGRRGQRDRSGDDSPGRARRAGAARSTCGQSCRSVAGDRSDDPDRRLLDHAAALPVGARDGRAAARQSAPRRRDQTEPAARERDPAGAGSARLSVVAMARLSQVNLWGGSICCSASNSGMNCL